MRVRSLAQDVGSVAQDAWTLLTARTRTGSRRSPSAIVGDLRRLARLARRVGGGNAAAGRPIADRLLTDHPDLRMALISAVASDVQRGELTSALEAVRRLRSLSDTTRFREREARIVDRLRELEPGWLPAIPGPPGPIDPRATNVVMHLLKASLPDRSSGYTIRSRETLRAQVEAGLDPFVVTPFGYPPGRPDAPPIEHVEGVAHHRLAPGVTVEDLAPADALGRMAVGAAEVARLERPAIIHAASGHRGYENALVGLALKAHLQLPLVYEVRGFLETSWTGDPTLVDGSHVAELTRRRMATEDRVMAAADGIATLGIAMRDELVARGVPSDKIIVVPNGIDPVAFAPTAPDPDLRRRYGLDGRFVFGYISNLDHVREGHDLLIEATARLLAAGRAVACLIVGDGLRRVELEAKAAEAGVADSVVFTGRVPHDEVRSHYALLDAFVIARVPGRAAHFTTPLKPYEAMAMGIPLVVSDLPALTEIAAPGERGSAFPPGDAAALVAVLERLMDQPASGASMAAAGRSWVLAERTWASNGPRYRALYERILAGTQR